MRSTGHGGKSRWYDDQSQLTERPIQLRKTKVITHRKTDAPKRRIESDGLAASFDRPAFVVALFALTEGEQMYLVVARNALPVRVEDQRRAAHTRRVSRRDRHRASDHPDAMLTRHTRQERLLHAFAICLPRRHFVGCSVAKQAKLRGQQNQLGAP